MLFFLFFIIFASNFIECCDPQRIIANVSSQSFHVNRNDPCEYTVEAVPEKSIQLAFDCGYKIDIWLKFQVNDVEHEIYVTQLHNARSCWNHHYDYYTSPKNVGLRLEVQNTGYEYREFNIKRIETDHEICQFPYIVVGINETIIQENQSGDAHCAYRLVPDVSDKNFNEILLNLDSTMDYKIQKHNNGSIGKIESKSQSKLFPIGVIDLSFSRSGSIPRISANLVHISCTCGETTFSNFPEHNNISIRSPGFPSANCPLEECEYNINYSSTKPEFLLFNIQSELDKEDQLIMNETVNYKKVINYPSFMPKSFAFEPRKFAIKYKASDENMNRFFEINVTRIPIPEECRCSSYLDKSYTESGSFRFVIPKTCENVFCYWRIDSKKKDSSLNRLVVNMALENPNTNDVISCNDEKFYGSKLLDETLYSTKNIPMQIEFRRFNLKNEEDTRLNIGWNFTRDCECPTKQLIIAKDSVKALTTPNYPDKYCSNTKCWKNITAPNNTSIELTIVNLELENFHDFLRIYDENNNMIAELTGKFENHVVVSPGNAMNLFFESDSNRNFKGYFIHVTSTEKSTGSNKILIFILTFLVVFVIAVLIGLLKFGVPKKLSNGVVQFSNYPTGSNGSINISSM